MSEREICANCRFMYVVVQQSSYVDGDDPYDEEPFGKYQCRFSPPQATGNPKDAGWLDIELYWWCGQFQKAPET